MPTDWLQTRNNAADVLTAEVGAGDTSLEVSDAASEFPGSFPYRLTVWDAESYADPGDDPGMEILEVSSSEGNVLDVTRGAEGTPAVEHSPGDAVRLLLTAGIIEQMQGVISSHDHGPGGDGGQIDHNTLGNYEPDEHIDWTDASSDLKTTGHAALGQTAVTAGTVLGVAELFGQTGGNVRGIAVDTTLEPAGPLTGPLRNYALSFNSKWSSAQDGSPNGLLYGILGNTETAAGATGDLFRMSAIRASSWHYGSGDVTQMDVVYSLLRNDAGSTQDGHIVTGYNYFAAAYTGKSTGRIGTRYGLYVADITGGGAADSQYGIYVEDLSGAGSNTAAYLGGDVQVNGLIAAAGYKSGGTAGWSGAFTNADGDTVTVAGGIITDVS